MMKNIVSILRSHPGRFETAIVRNSAISIHNILYGATDIHGSHLSVKHWSERSMVSKRYEIVLVKK